MFKTLKINNKPICTCFKYGSTERTYIFEIANRALKERIPDSAIVKLELYKSEIKAINITEKEISVIIK